MAIVLAIANQKGGCSKTTVAANLGIGLAMEGKKVLLIDSDPQGSLTVSLGHPTPDNIPDTLASIMMNVINEEDFPPEYGVIHHDEGVDLIPANMELSGLEVSLANAMSREMILKEYVDSIRDSYDAVIIDTMPSLGVMTINALAAADQVLIPVQAAFKYRKCLYARCPYQRDTEIFRKRPLKKDKIPGPEVVKMDDV